MPEGIAYIEGSIIIAAFQLLLVAILNLVTRKQQNILLGLLLLTFVDSARNAFAFYHISNEFMQVVVGQFRTHLFYGPLIFLYVGCVLNKVKSRDLLLHLFIPTLGSIAFTILPFVAFLNNSETPSIPIQDAQFFIYSFYFILILRLVRNPQNWSMIKQPRRYMIFFWVIGSYLLLNHVDSLVMKYWPPRNTIEFAFYVDVFLYISIFLYLSLYGITELNWLKAIFIKSRIQVDQSLDENMIKTLTEKLNRLLKENKIHTNPDLNMQLFAHSLHTSEQVARDFLKLKKNQSFSDFINEQRVLEFKANLQNKNYDHLDILGIANESGFSSKATFNRTFKKIEGITPKEYRNKVLMNGNN